jgi:hypothetical protein
MNDSTTEVIASGSGLVAQDGVSGAPARLERMIRGFEVLAALHALDEQDGPGPHRLRDIAAQTGLPRQTVCRLLRLAETQYRLVIRPEVGYYALVHSTEERQLPAWTASGLEDEGANGRLAALAERTGAAALMYEPFQSESVRQRRLVAHALGTFREQVVHAEREQREAIVAAPLLSDAAGIAILGQNGARFQTPATGVRWSGDGSTVSSASPLTGMDLIAATVWRRRAVAGSLALLIPRTTSPYERAGAARALALEAAGLSHAAARSAAPGGRLAS